MSEYRHTDQDGDRLTASGIGITVKAGEKSASVWLPKDDAERLKLAETILERPILDINPPRKVAAVIYEDELPEVEDTESPVTVQIDGSRQTALNRDPRLLRKVALRYLAAAHHIEARDAEKQSAQALDEQLRPWRGWLLDHTSTEASYPVIEEVAAALVEAGIPAPEGGAA